MHKNFLAAFFALVFCSGNVHSGLPELSTDGFELTGEFLWWKGKASNLLINVAETDPTVIPPSTINNSTYWEFGYSPGFRLGFSYQPCDWCSGLALYANFTHFRSTDTLTLDLIGTPDSTFLVNTVLNLFTIGDGTTFGYTGSADFLYNRFDLGIARTSFEYRNLTIIPKAAFTYVHTRLSTFEDTFLSETDTIALISNKDSYSGYGATIGFDAIYDFWSGSSFSIYSSVGLTGLYGPFHFTFQQEDLVATTGELSSTQDEDQSPNIGRWMSDIQLGLQYEACICGCYECVARIGWEFLYFPDEVNFYRFGDPASMSVNGLTVGLGVGF